MLLVLLLDPLGFPGRWSVQHPEPHQPAAEKCSPVGRSLWMRPRAPQCSEKWSWEIRPGWCPSNSGCKMYTILSYAASVTGWGVHGPGGSSRSDCGVGIREALGGSFWHAGIWLWDLWAPTGDSWCGWALDCCILGTPWCRFVQRSSWAASLWWRASCMLTLLSWIHSC